MNDAIGKPTQLKELALPLENFIFTIKAFIYRVCYRNPGKNRFSVEPVAVATEDKNTGQKSFLMLDGSKQTKTPEEMDAYLQAIIKSGIEIQEPQPQQNNKNVTLDIKSGQIRPQSQFKSQAPLPKE